MTWIKTVSGDEDGHVRDAVEGLKPLYPPEYSAPIHPTTAGSAGIMTTHSLIPDALYHAFATYGVLLSSELPLSRAQQEMIATVVSAANRCKY